MDSRIIYEEDLLASFLRVHQIRISRYLVVNYCTRDLGVEALENDCKPEV
jgi:hypothetical protein